MICLEKKIRSVLDIGTASGDFLFYLPKKIKGLGIDKSAELINEALSSRKRENNSFCVMELEELNKLKVNQYDAITCHGTLVTIKNYEDSLKEMIRLKPRLIVINDFFNPDGIDIECGYKRSQKNQKFI